MRKICYAFSCENRSTEMKKAIRATTDREDILGALADYIVSEEHPAKEESPMHAERTDKVSQGILRDATVGISAWPKTP